MRTYSSLRGGYVVVLYAIEDVMQLLCYAALHMIFFFGEFHFC